MVKIPLGISFGAEGDGFVLRRKTADRKTIAIRLSAQEMLGLKGTIDLWSGRMLSQSQAESGQVEPVVAHPVERVQVQPDALNERVLLMLGVAPDAEMTFAVPAAAAEHIAAQIPLVLSHIRTAAKTRQ